MQSVRNAYANKLDMDKIKKILEWTNEDKIICV